MKVHLIEDWKKSWKFASVQINALGFIVMGIDFLQQFWGGIPKEIMDNIPHAPTIGLILFGLGMVGRILKLKEPEALPDGNQ